MRDARRKIPPRGTAEQGYADGALGKAQIGAVRLARTMINGVSNNARAETIKENSDVIDGINFVGALDGKTCPYCGSLEGYIWRGDEMNAARRPPLHPNCRCALSPHVDRKDKDGNILDNGERPAASADFEALAKEEYNKKAREIDQKHKESGKKNYKPARRWDDLAKSTRDDLVRKARKDFEKTTGKPAYKQVPESTTFVEYFKGQSDEFKRSWLGAKKFELYKKGQLTEKDIFNPSLTHRMGSTSFLKFSQEQDYKSDPHEMRFLESLYKSKGSPALRKPGPRDFTAEKALFPKSLAEVKIIDPWIGGSTGAALVEARDGARYIMKKGASPEHIKSECAADSFYQAVGIDVPPYKLYKDKKGNPVKLSKYLENAVDLDTWWSNASDADRQKMSSKLREGLAADVLIGNWDVGGMDGDNILITPDGTPWRIDNGGALGYRAQGAKKDPAQWSDKCLVDDLWTMIGKADRINLNVDSTIPNYYGINDLYPHELAKTIAQKWNDGGWDPVFNVLSSSDQRTVTARLDQIWRIANRAEDNLHYGRTRESTGEVTDFAYSMTRDGIPEILKKQPAPRDMEESDFTARTMGWYCETSKTWSCNGKAYRSFSEYLADKMGKEEYNFFVTSNLAQGGDSYYREETDPLTGHWLNSSSRKMTCLYNMGLDCTDKKKFKSFNSFKRTVESKGWYFGGSNPKDNKILGLEGAFTDMRRRKNLFRILCTASSQYDAAMQLILENTQRPEIDKYSRTIILQRNEEPHMFQGKQIGELTGHPTGVCESHHHIKGVDTLSPGYGDESTAIRVPFSRVHGVWWMERARYITDTDFEYGRTTQFLDAEENEIVADTHGLPIVYAGLQAEDLQPTHDALNLWEQRNPDKKVTGTFL